VRLVLASASPARLGVLQAAGLDPLVEVADIDEPALLAATPEGGAGARVTALAGAKATTVARRIADAVVVGCDSMLLLDGELQGKPGDPDTARQRWRAMAGRTGELVTGHTVLRTADGAIDRVAEGHAVTTVRFARPSEAELEAYVATGEPLSVAPRMGRP
jgi:septum formation protein